MKKYTFDSFYVPLWMEQAVSELKPRKQLSVSRWAEQNRILSSLSSAAPGPWRNSVTPYLVGIMDAFSESSAEQIIFVKPTQVGGTTAMENMLGSLIDQQPGPTLIVYPSDALAETTSESRLIPMFRDCPELTKKFQENDSKKLELKFSDMRVYLTGANSPADLSSKPIRYLFMDEVDKYPGSSKRESDPVSLAIERTKTFFNRKIFMASTPTLKTGHIWKAKEAAEAEYHYFVPCPHCGALIELQFQHLKWASKEDVDDLAERAESACYVCQKCACVITDRDKGKMLRQGKWQAVRGTAAHPKSIAFWLNTLYSPFTSFAEIAREYLRSKDDPELLHNFVNSWLAEPWEDTRVKTSADMVLERQTDIPAWQAPDWAKLITGGVDVQENCLYWTIRAWGDHMTSQNIAHGQALSFREVERVMNIAFEKADGQKMMVNLALIDSGDQTDMVYDFCLANPEWALPCKGTSTRQSHYNLSTVNKTGSRASGMTLVLVDGGKYKDMIAARMRRENGRGSWMVFAGCDLEYATQVTAEHKITERSGGRENQKWVPKTAHAANHYLDCEVYAAAAADILEVRTLGKRLEESETAKAPKQPEPSAPEENWIGQHEGWI
jgi:phage terminase large subunit GpA-like protein